MVVNVTHGVVKAAGSVEEADELTRTNKSYRTSRVAGSRHAGFRRPTILDGRAYIHRDGVDNRAAHQKELVARETDGSGQLYLCYVSRFLV
jgi:hypothetical protein